MICKSVQNASVERELFRETDPLKSTIKLRNNLSNGALRDVLRTSVVGAVLMSRLNSGTLTCGTAESLIRFVDHRHLH